MIMNTSKNKNWPYHLYEGSKPELQGSYVPCANNPCSEHGGSEVYATSAEEAYTKAHQNDTWGFTSHTNKSNYEQTVKNNQDDNTDEPQSANNLAQQLMSKIYEMSSMDTELAVLLSTDNDITASNNANNDSNNTDNNTTNTDSNNITNANSNASNDTANSNASNANDTANNSAGNVKTASSNKKPVKLNKANNGYVNSKAKELAIKQNLCIDGSPLLHRLTSSEIEKYETESDGINIQKLANDVFNGVQLSNADIAGIRMRSEEVFDTTTKEEKTAIHDFTSVDFSNINKYLRDKDYFNKFKKIGGSKGENELIIKSINNQIKNVNNHIRNISNVMHRKETSNVINKDTIVFRSRYCKENNKIKRGGEEKTYYNAVANSIKNGNESIITRPDFMSTTWDVPDDFVDNECCYIIKIPKGTRGLDVSHHSAHSTENELIIDKGYQFKVVGIYEFSKLSKDPINDGETRWVLHPPVIALELITSSES